MIGYWKQHFYLTYAISDRIQRNLKPEHSHVMEVLIEAICLAKTKNWNLKKELENRAHILIFTPVLSR